MVEYYKDYKSLKKSLIESDALKIAKSRRYALLKGEGEVDGLNALLFFMETGCDYRYLGEIIKSQGNIATKHNPKIYDFPLFSRMLSINISKFLRQIGGTYEDFFDLLDLDIYRGKLLLGRGEALPLSACLKIEKNFGVSLPLWFSELLDIESLAANWLAPIRKKMYLPKILQAGLGSKMRLFESAVSFVRQELGSDIVSDVLRRMQLDQSLFKFPDKDISLNVFKQFHHLLRYYGTDDDFYIRMGGYNVFSNEISKIDFRQRFMPQNSSDVLCSLSQFISPRIDRNFQYEIISRTDNLIMMYTKPRKEMMIQMGTKIIGNKDVALYRFGHIGNMPIFFDLPNVSSTSYLNYDSSNDHAIFYYFL